MTYGTKCRKKVNKCIFLTCCPRHYALKTEEERNKEKHTAGA